MRKIYIVGNLLVEEDALPLRLKPLLQSQFPRVEFIEFDPTEDFPDDLNEFCLIDTVKGLNEPAVIEDIDEFLNKKAVSMHDFDLGWNLKLYKKAGKLKKILIIAVPYGKSPEEFLPRLNTIISGII
jgi:Ni,Fe-hydrogenase maturation factor